MKAFPSFFYFSIPVLAAAFMLLATMFFFSGCYILTQGVAMLGYLHRAVPLESLLTITGESSKPDPENRGFVERILDIRRFTTEDLGLQESTNYTRYVDIDRDYLAAVVSAAAPDSFTRHEWWFPVAGAVPYKGFFNPKDARREEEKLKKRGLDVWIRQIDAFSTLGWFSDPLYSYMRGYPVYRLADLIIHETLHATVYLNGQSQFNEELAEFVGREGSRLYMERTFGLDSEEYRRMVDSEKDTAAYIAYIQGLIAELETLYTQNLDREVTLQQKATVIRASQSRFDADYESLFHSENYRDFSRLPVNNAYLELFRLYYSGGDYLQDIYDRSGRNLPRFIATAKTLTAKDNPRKQLEKALSRTFIP